MPSDFAIHSDVLVYWTGKKDIEVNCGTDNWPDLNRRPSVEEHKLLTSAYLQRLKDVLKYGLWMTNQPPPAIDTSTPVQEAACTCFTELKLSESRHHATNYGRLGIGFKRPFLFLRSGRPVVYYSADEGAWMKRDHFLHDCVRNIQDRRLLHFFKPMNSDPVKRNYDFYSESEWRIVFGDRLLEERLVVDPRDAANSEAHGFFKSLPSEKQKQLQYLIPVTGWLAVIIYPSLEIKNAAARDDDLRDLLQEVNRRGSGGPEWERTSHPVELDLDLCRNL